MWMEAIYTFIKIPFQRLLNKLGMVKVGSERNKKSVQELVVFNLFGKVLGVSELFDRRVTSSL